MHSSLVCLDGQSSVNIIEIIGIFFKNLTVCRTVHREMDRQKKHVISKHTTPESGGGGLIGTTTNIKV